MIEEIPEVRLVTCRECDNTQTFQLPKPGETIIVICHHCQSEIVKVTRKENGELELDPPDIELQVL